MICISKESIEMKQVLTIAAAITAVLAAILSIVVAVLHVREDRCY